MGRIFSKSSKTRNSALDTWTLPGQYTYDGMVFSAAFPKESLDKVKDFKLYPEDVVIVSPPKSGTVWISEMTWLALNNADIETAKSQHFVQRVPLIEIVFPGAEPHVDILNKKPPGRVFSTHLPAHFFQSQIEAGKPKVICFFRNPKDCIAAYYHFYQANPATGFFPGGWDDFFQLFLDKKLHSGDWFDIMLSWWKFKDDPNFLFMKFEDVKEDHEANVKKLASFLDVNLDQSQVETIVEHTTFTSMKKNPMVQLGDTDHLENYDNKVSPYIRKGIIGDWKNYFSQSQSQLTDKIYHQRLDGTGLTFRFE